MFIFTGFMANNAFNLCGLFKISIFVSLDRNRNIGFNFALLQATVKIENWLPFAQNWTYSHEIGFLYVEMHALMNECKLYGI